MVVCMNKQKGFTLIELVVVIVILGILAATAAPKFIDVSTDAKVATIENIAGSLKTAATLANMKARVKGCEKDAKCDIEILQGTMEIEFGYPEARGEGSDLDIVDMIEFDSDVFTVNDDNNSNVEIGYDVEDNLDGECFARYIEQSGTGHPNPSSDEPHIEIVTDGC